MFTHSGHFGEIYYMGQMEVEVETSDYGESLNGAAFFCNFSTEIRNQSEVDSVSSREEKRQMTNFLPLICLFGTVNSSNSKEGIAESDDIFAAIQL